MGLTLSMFDVSNIENAVMPYGLATLAPLGVFCQTEWGGVVVTRFLGSSSQGYIFQKRLVQLKPLHASMYVVCRVGIGGGGGWHS